MFNNETALHSIALETAKAYVNSNFPEYKTENGTTKMAIDMMDKYITAYLAASKELDSKRASFKAKTLI